MSVIAVFMERESALVGVDTAAIAPSGDIGSMSKLIPLVHMNAVIAYRGNTLFLETLFCMCHMQGGDLDALLERMPEILKNASSAFVSAARMMGADSSISLTGHEAVFIGWSDQEGKMICRVYYQESENSDFTCTPIDTWFAAPHDSSFVKMPVAKLMPDMISVTRDQVRMMHELAPEAAAGGRLIVADVRKKSMSIGHMADFPVQSYPLLQRVQSMEKEAI